MKSEKSPLTVGVLIGNYEEAYPRELRAGLCDAAKEFNVRLVFFVGKSLCHPDEFRQNIIYHLASPERIDGLIIAAGAIGDFCTPRFLEVFCRSFKPLPMVSIAVKIPGIPSVVAENKSGMRQLMLHLVRDHGYRRIAFIRGPEFSSEAEERLSAYREVLREHGIPERPEFILPGNFNFFSGIEAVKIMLDQRRLWGLEAVVGCNDASTYGAFQELDQRGYAVPGDVALAGFDYAEELEFISTPLTTVSQNLNMQGRKALEILLDQIDGKEVPDMTRIATELIIQESCGCAPGAWLFPNAAPVPPEGKADLTMAGPITEGIFPVGRAQGCFETLRAALEQDMRAGVSPDCFIRALNDILSGMAGSKRDILSLRRAVWALSQWAKLQFPDHPSFILFEGFQKAQIQIGNALQRHEAKRGYGSETVLNCMRRFNSRTNNAFTDMDGLMSYIADEMPVFGLKNCFISLYQTEVQGGNEQGWTIPEKSRLCLAYREGKPVRRAKDMVFPTRLLVPDDLMPQDIHYPLIVKSLASREKQFGFIVFEDRQSHPLIYDMVREQISNSIYTIHLYKELRDLSIKDDLTGLYNRRGLYLLGEQCYERAVQSGGCFSALFIDLDSLKRINDRYGHKEGDIAIQTTAELLTGMFGKSDIVARLGGDEFVVLTTDPEVADTEEIMNCFTKSFEEKNREIGEKPYRLTISIGIARFNPDNARSLDELLDEADRNLYKQKKRKNGEKRPES